MMTCSHSDQTLDEFSPSDWDKAEPPLPDTIDVWRVPLIGDADRLRGCRDWLSPDELERADRYRHEAAKRAFLVTRSALRALLSRCLGGVSPREIAFRYLPQGKPELDSETLGPSPWRFNVSHSGELALIAIAHGVDIGVDVETVRPMPEALALAKRFFSIAERAELEGMPASDRESAFLRGWTRKEAFVKAVGTGLAKALDSFDVSLAVDALPRIIAIQGQPAPEWRLVHLEPGTGYLGALAVPLAQFQARGFAWIAP